MTTHPIHMQRYDFNVIRTDGDWGARRCAVAMVHSPVGRMEFVINNSPTISLSTTAIAYTTSVLDVDTHSGGHHDAKWDEAFGTDVQHGDEHHEVTAGAAGKSGLVRRSRLSSLRINS